MYSFKTIFTRLSRYANFIAQMAHSPLYRTVYGDSIDFHLRVVLYHLGQVLDYLIRWKDVNFVEDETV